MGKEELLQPDEIGRRDIGDAAEEDAALAGFTVVASGVHNGRGHDQPGTKNADMCSACEHADHMPVMIQIRNVPSELHRELKARAALEGMSLSDYLLRELRQTLDRPTLNEIRKRLSSRQPVRPRVAPAAAVRAERNSR